MADHVRQTLLELEELAKEHECVAVGFSGGKDSLATLDLAVRFFEKIVPYFYYFVPGIKYEESLIEIARTHYKLPMLMYPSAESIEALRTGVYCDEHPEFDGMPEFSRRTLYNWIKHDTGASLILTGEKMADGAFRRLRMKNQKKSMADVVFPLKQWRKWDVLNYLKGRKLPIPDPGTGSNGGVRLMENEIMHLYRYHREDYERLKLFFPYIEVEVCAAKWFGQHPDKAAARNKRRPADNIPGSLVPGDRRHVTVRLEDAAELLALLVSDDARIVRRVLQLASVHLLHLEALNAPLDNRRHDGHG